MCSLHLTFYFILALAAYVYFIKANIKNPATDIKFQHTKQSNDDWPFFVNTKIWLTVKLTVVHSTISLRALALSWYRVWVAQSVSASAQLGLWHAGRAGCRGFEPTQGQDLTSCPSSGLVYSDPPSDAMWRQQLVRQQRSLNPNNYYYPGTKPLRLFNPHQLRCISYIFMDTWYRFGSRSK